MRAERLVLMSESEFCAEVLTGLKWQGVRDPEEFWNHREGFFAAMWQRESSPAAAVYAALRIAAIGTELRYIQERLDDCVYH